MKIFKLKLQDYNQYNHKNYLVFFMNNLKTYNPYKIDKTFNFTLLSIYK